MAERLKTELLEREKLVDVLAGPDAYRDLPRLLALAHGGQRASNVLLSLEETYADVMPVHHTPQGHSAFIHTGVPAEVKRRRLEELIGVFREEAARVNASLIGSTQLLLVEGESKRSTEELCGRNDGNLKVIFPSPQAFAVRSGDYVLVKITSASSQSLRGHALGPASLRSAGKVLPQDYRDEQMEVC
ncbi:hypothetical protein SKAU_G00178050 [Synaphobranchus kaupii]|uniref:TRAM domain-containing protein n=1 Tax=Synaphobranchus kaupii TaxID=118154 RepID=A0A9Q1J1E1_SYNKA|nr:hypothetical protein SKAU_G00178000 [Synaphobranchus kaupii]KAJ8361280.1 hypothetical protein SKAU_G00178050 [Synaphobranchus kaupii]